MLDYLLRWAWCFRLVVAFCAHVDSQKLALADAKNIQSLSILLYPKIV